MKKSTKQLLMGVAAMAGAVGIGSSVDAIPLNPAGDNNYIGVGAGLQENYVRTQAVPANAEYLSPAEAYGGVVYPAPPTQAPGSFESVRVDGMGNILGVNTAQPSVIQNQPSDARGLVPNTLLPVAAPGHGLPIWAARNGVIGELDENTTIGVTLAEDLTTVVARNFTPSFTSAINPANLPVDDGLAPGSVAGDVFEDLIPLFNQSLGIPLAPGGTDTATVTVQFVGRNTDISGPAKILTPIIEVYEDDQGVPTPFDIDTIAAQLALQEADFDHTSGSPINVGPTLTNAVDDSTGSPSTNPLLRGEVVVGGTATLVWTFTDTDMNANFNVGDQVNLDVLVSGGQVQWVSGQLVDQGLVAAGSTGSFGWTLSQEMFIDTPQGTDPNLNEWDFLDLTPGGSNSANLSFTTQRGNEVPEPVTSGLSMLALCGLGSYITRRRS